MTLVAEATRTGVQPVESLITECTSRHEENSTDEEPTQNAFDHYVRRTRDALPAADAVILFGLQDRSTDKKSAQDFTAKRLRWQDAVMLDSRLSTAERLVGWFIGSHVAKESGLAFFSQDYAARMLGFKSARSIERAVSALIACGWVHAIQPNRRKTIRYMLILNNIDRIDDFKIAVREALHEKRSVSLRPY